MYKDKIQFNKDGKLTVLQVSDAQDMHIPRKAMFKMLNRVYDTVNPDLIVLTGDNILGNHLDDARFGNKKSVKTEEGTYKRMKKALGLLLNPIEKRKIPFAFIYGNHDDMNRISKDRQAEIYGGYDYCVPYNTTDKSVDCDTYNIPVYSSSDENKIGYNIWMLDSAGSDSEGKPIYGHVQKNTLDWYEKKSDELKVQNNGEPVMSLMFQHIPVDEIKELYTDCDEDDKNAVKLPDGRCVKLDCTKANGYAFEIEHNTSEYHNQIDILKKHNDVCGLVFGHDHMNSFTAKIKDVNIVQTSGASFRCYGNVITRGVRVFIIDENDPTSFETYQIHYFDLFGRSLPSVIRYIFSADEYEKIKTLMIVLFGIIGVGLVTYVLAILNLFGF